MGNATGLFNMLRNIGGSIGIAMATTALIRRADLHQTYLAANLTPSGAALQQKSAMIAGYLGHQIGARRRAPGLLRPDLRADAAAGGHAGVCRRVSLDGGSGADLRRLHLAVQEAAKALLAPARRALKTKAGDLQILAPGFRPGGVQRNRRIKNAAAIQFVLRHRRANQMRHF